MLFKDFSSCYSWDEMASRDLPAMLNFVLKKTLQPSLVYVGHSQGTLIAFAEFSRNKALAKRVRNFYALGPVTTVGHIKGPLRYLAYFTPEFKVRKYCFITHAQFCFS